MTALCQASFDFTPPAPAAGEVEALVAWLRDHPGFHTAATLAKRLDLSDRKIRQLAELSNFDIVSGPGSPGYCHISHCPPEKLRRITNAHRSQARAMFRRYIGLHKRAHSLIG